MSEQKMVRDRFEQRTKQLFDESVAGIDAAARARLVRARHRALEDLAPAKSRGWRWSLVPAGGVAVATVLAVLLVVHPRAPTETGLQASSLNDLEILLGEEDLQMLEEDIEFYGWLEQQPELKNAGDSVG
ncbi:MAG TPA: hypothetical protein VHH11_11235 [Gammaproteobacteria bacterium]|jgi:hypothetical protein|nr:hypothetical protein [Gammaproteobacteria bacterium]